MANSPRAVAVKRAAPATRRTTQRPLKPLDDYVESRPLLRHVRIMHRFFDEAVSANPTFGEERARLHCAYMEILNEELAPHALTFALALTQLEDAYPEIDRNVTAPFDTSAPDDEQPLRPDQTRLGRYLRGLGIRPSALAREAGYSKSHLFGLGAAHRKYTQGCIDRVVAAVGRLSGEPVTAADLFDVDQVEGE
jgi:hypothetical protein